MKKILIILTVFFIGIISVNANTIYYKNNYDVSFTKEEYDFFTEMYYEGYQEHMTKEDFNYFNNTNKNYKLVEQKTITDILSRATSITDSGKTLKIAKVASGSNSIISTTLIWNSAPNVKSYDVIGARLENTKLINSPITKFVNNSGTIPYNISVSASNGFGASILLSGSNMKITQTYTVSNGGTVYASYQHAKMTVTLNDSKKYSISSAGYGKVFRFDYAVTNKYDAMNGVSIAV
ncbi:MAG: hypothetical protein HFI36_00200 [Bacilli bacterium]|jgi:hypothetical protein|nr:hypothetical protein [Bacilli bacterium]